MATYVNDLRLKEIATGDESGTWGTSTNTNLELIGEALGYGSQDCFSSDANATTTVADGATDPARALYFKVTSSATLSATRELTIAPNTVSRVMIIENATTGSQIITIKQGSGNTVNVANGAVKVLYLDGAGSGAAVQDGLVDLDLTGTTTAVTVTASGVITGLTVEATGDTAAGDNAAMGYTGAEGLILTGQGSSTDVTVKNDADATVMSIATGTTQATFAGEVVAASLDISGNIDVDGTTNLDAVDIDGAVQIDNTVTVGADDTGYDVKFFGATASAYMLWDESADDLILAGAAKLGVGTAPDARLHVQENGEPGGDGTLILEANSSSRQLQIAPPSNAANGYLNIKGGNLLIQDDGTEIARFQGTTSFNVSGRFSVGYANSSSAINNGIQVLTGGIGGGVQLNRETGTPSSGESLGSYAWKGQDSANTNAAAEALIEAVATENYSGSTAATKMVFKTKNTGTGPGNSPATALTLEANQSATFESNVLVDTTTTDPAGNNSAGVSLTPAAGISVQGTATALVIGVPSAQDYGIAFRYQGDLAGRIGIAANDITLADVSDYRLKENIVPLTDALTKIKALKPSSYNFINDPDKTHQGFVAHELQEVIPNAVSGEKDALITEATKDRGTVGEIDPQAVDLRKLIPTLVAAIKEQQAHIESLTTRITELEA